ncbi:metal-dependent transcriptional regulator [Erysipelothrix rhusiopathiae]|uniref:metal-dependent transcriptional regulator n=1 Tax=Erysipelothrix rhusiopathiae TaxID=1648 RepID=UPI000210B3B8|nr:metal-dependent transcriptional regulator [Erysipelothrix rhusiopathiae]AGN25042.1 iron-dependent repressor [Erysipelothrix rhusiopathiae SY1027]AMS10233.1 iron-dependent repressor [Erysipelothrix rhusiopathiae]AOO67425.1 iron-dependent repressor [Erysipelothrix rhusiopathiae]AWU40728.1 metal-dependent transcriptional regulator [Erysipelothrix rhusiopathiae]MDE8284370.1 metal-dependent transcriptional regulator [Erysipelothrix rhusiopathiae]
MTPNREDYIKTIYSCNEKNEKLTNKELAERLGVSPASTSEMVRKLIESDHVVKDKELGLSLTEKATLEAKTLVRKHRLWEVFLVEHLGYSWTEVHEDAEVLEHGTSELLANRLNEFLGFPEHCPHGSRIYGNTTADINQSVPLSSLKKGQRGVLSKVRDHEELLNYLEHVKLNLGATFEVVEVDPYEGPHHILIDNRHVPVSHKASQEIYVILDSEE